MSASTTAISTPNILCHFAVTAGMGGHSLSIANSTQSMPRGPSRSTVSAGDSCNECALARRSEDSRHSGQPSKALEQHLRSSCSSSCIVDDTHTHVRIWCERSAVIPDSSHPGRAPCTFGANTSHLTSVLCVWWWWTSIVFLICF